jgi:ABC-type lipopolysaccharide export system ATPase subunit
MTLTAAACAPRGCLQDDIVHEDLTVRENLAYSAKLRCAASERAAHLSEVVDDVVELLRLRHVQHSVVGSVEKRGVRRARSRLCCWNVLFRGVGQGLCKPCSNLP